MTYIEIIDFLSNIEIIYFLRLAVLVLLVSSLFYIACMLDNEEIENNKRGITYEEAHNIRMQKIRDYEYRRDEYVELLREIKITKNEIKNLEKQGKDIEIEKDYLNHLLREKEDDKVFISYLSKSYGETLLVTTIICLLVAKVLNQLLSFYL